MAMGDGWSDCVHLNWIELIYFPVDSITACENAYISIETSYKKEPDKAVTTSITDYKMLAVPLDD